MTITDRLAPLRAHTGARRTTGLDDATVARFAASHSDLVEAIDAAVAEHAKVAAEFPELINLDEAEQAHVVQGGYVNFYSDDTVNPYIALVARGPWIVTLNGAVL
ncbi:MAG TPA: lysine 6-aminotransferase, partial [Luteimonas sp.]|nr:lysine 6-aminotransferase [Luteimonas sp.]